MSEGAPPRQHPVAREVTGFVAAVFVGSLGGLIIGQVLSPLAGPTGAETGVLAAGTTLTAATHARLIHGLRARELVPRALLAAPLAWAVMRAVHAILGR